MHTAHIVVPPPNVLFIFAHQDDEVAAATRILYELAGGAIVRCAFLTDGTGKGVKAAVRDRESLSALTSLGVAAEHIAFIGSTVPIADGSLVTRLEDAFAQLEVWLAGRSVDRCYCLAWEGGHPDHDASQLVAAAIAMRSGSLAQCFELPLYRAGKRFGVRVLLPLAEGGPWQRRRLTMSEAVRAAGLVRNFPSQWWSWLGLFPETFLRLVLLRRECIRPVDPRRWAERPHPGKLLYERRFRHPYARFVEAAMPFIRSRLAAPSGDAPTSTDLR